MKQTNNILLIIFDNLLYDFKQDSVICIRALFFSIIVVVRKISET